MARLLIRHDTGDITSEGICEIRSVEVLQLIHLHIGDSTCQRELFLGSHTCNNDFIHRADFGFCQHHVNGSLVFDNDLLGLETCVIEYQCLVLLNLDGVLTINISGRT